MKIKAYNYIIYLLLISLLSIGITLSRFSTTLTNSDIGTPSGTTVSNPIIMYIPQEGLADDCNNKILTLNDIQPNSPTQSYYFNIVNFSGTSISDMVFCYSINLETLGALPLEFKIYNIQGENYIPLTRNSTAEITLPKNIKQTHMYRLDISWKTANTNYVNDYRFSQEIDYINIVVEAEQAQ